ncbi:MAG: ATP-binding protein [Desulfovibrio sp.]|nr:ATP-binding protein [Desulfovibrio sp.]
MRIAIASGKGGAGKTTLTAALASVWPGPLVLADADAEAPNLHLYLSPRFDRSEDVSIRVPVDVRESCTACGLCRDLCKFGAIARFGKKITVFSDMCHGCGGCFRVCTENALVSGERLLGQVEEGRLSSGIPFIQAKTRVGEVMTPPLLRVLLKKLSAFSEEGCDVLIDSPPGISCPAVTVARNVDLMLLVIDPSPFGFADFKLALEAFRKLGLPLVCVINRSGMPGNEPSESALNAFLAAEKLPLAGKIPFSRNAAAASANGHLLTALSGDVRASFCEIAENIRKTACERGCSPLKGRGRNGDE